MPALPEFYARADEIDTILDAYSLAQRIDAFVESGAIDGDITWDLLEGSDTCLSNLYFHQRPHVQAIDDPSLSFTRIHDYSIGYPYAHRTLDPADPFTPVRELEIGFQHLPLEFKRNGEDPELEDRLHALLNDPNADQQYPHGEIPLTALGIDREHVRRLLEDLRRSNERYCKLREATERLRYALLRIIFPK